MSEVKNSQEEVKTNIIMAGAGRCKFKNDLILIRRTVSLMRLLNRGRSRGQRTLCIPLPSVCQQYKMQDVVRSEENDENRSNRLFVTACAHSVFPFRL